MRTGLRASAAVIALALTGCGGSTQTSSSVSTAAAKPATPIAILSPHNGTRTSASKITVSGTAAPGDTLAYIEDPGPLSGIQTVTIGPDGHWSATLPLAAGQNGLSFTDKGSQTSITVTRVVHHTAASRPKPKPATSPPAAPSGPPVTGFGAADPAWNANHTPDSDFALGAVYNPDPSLPQINGHTGAEYTQVMHQGGHVTGYDYHFHNAPISQARAQVLTTNFPTDAQTLWFAVKDTCAQMVVQSNAVGRALRSPALGDSAGFVLVEFSSGVNEDHYDPGAVSSALFMLAPSGSQSDAPAC